MDGNIISSLSTGLSVAPLAVSIDPTDNGFLVYRSLLDLSTRWFGNIVKYDEKWTEIWSRGNFYCCWKFTMLEDGTLVILESDIATQVIVLDATGKTRYMFNAIGKELIQQTEQLASMAFAGTQMILSTGEGKLIFF
jgi:hypothetical protein